jgi:hypothetical protein
MFFSSRSPLPFLWGWTSRPPRTTHSRLKKSPSASAASSTPNSRDRSISCSFYHDPDRASLDGRPTANGISERLNTPAVVNRRYGRLLHQAA